jgi:hypothetical protein
MGEIGVNLLLCGIYRGQVRLTAPIRGAHLAQSIAFRLVGMSLVTLIETGTKGELGF